MNNVKSIKISDDDKKFVSTIIDNNLSMCSYENLITTMQACKYVKSLDIPGDFFECGVWRGGNSLLAAYQFNKNDESKNRKVFLLDTFLGMTQPNDIDNRISDKVNASVFYFDRKKEGYVDWCFATLDEVKNNFIRFDLLKDNVYFLKGKSEEVLCNNEHTIPDKISVLRLDTDFYESTLVELKVLYPRLSDGGVLIIDDYNFWEGCRKAVDDFFGSKPQNMISIDENAILIIK
jgi:hypothetical protein